MPQVHNRKLSMMADNSAFNKNSRFMATNRMTEGSKKRIRAFNYVENRLKGIKLRFFDRHAEIDLRRRERERQVIMDSLKRTLAYKLVVEKHNLTHAVDYQKALDDDYSGTALRHEVKHMVEYMKPDQVRERKAKALISENRRRYNRIIQRNKNSLDLICPPKRTSRYLFDEDVLNKKGDDNDDNSTRAPSTAEPSRAGDIFKQRLPTKPLLPLKKQAITRSFLLENAQKSMDVMDSNPSLTKAPYDLPPVQLHKRLPPAIAVQA
ncbi:uncharacterized protein LOC110458145 [Mizuhopecten yessoensis]|uniref:Uncharacterized protein n=1 Tax=Mizuhopecten yessoensis TaxID=6573 RepID=A0A210Q773_MIZYE|nr:uncharacterized protein LOC110458145 [Mizuhopecten yessoensis]OWF44586.1 hypothetical protein KP79_PYT12075 [Mizuhopecten yessoensis]